MAFYTGAAQLNLPRTPDAYFPMNAALPSISILAWSPWRPTNERVDSASASASSSSTPLTPPELTSTMETDEKQASPTVLPPIAHIHNLRPLTPAEVKSYPQPPAVLPKINTATSDEEFFEQKPQSPSIKYEEVLVASTTSPTTTASQRLQVQHTSMDTSDPPGITPNTSAAAASIIDTLALAPAPPAYTVDWLDFTRTRSAHFIAEKTCEMICYLWFSIPSHARSSMTTAAAPTGGDPLDPDSKVLGIPSVTSLQLVVTPGFVAFMQKLLETTQVSQSVIVLSLHYIHRLKEKNVYMPAQPGSEFRIAVAGLMMANKFLDDNTYTNKTWSEVSGIALDEINRMEREFLLGVDFNLYVDKTTYASWLNLLKGLVLAKERDARRLSRGVGVGVGGMRTVSSARRTVRSEREGRFWHPHHPHHSQLHRRHPGHHRLYAGQPQFGSTGPASRTYTHVAAAHANGNAAPVLVADDLFSSRRQSDTPPSNPVVYPYRHRARSTSPRSFTFSSASRSTIPVHVSTGSGAQQDQQQYPIYVAPTTASEVPQVDASQMQEDQGAYNQCYQPVPTANYTYPPPSPTSITNSLPLDPLPETTITLGTKRSAADAFASPPPSTTYISQQQPRSNKRSTTTPSVYAGLHSLQIPELANCSSSSSDGSRQQHSTNPSPLEGLGGFERMCLVEEEAHAQERERTAKRARPEAAPAVSTVIPQTLVAAYSMDDVKRRALPKNLFFYTLSSSPSAEEQERERERMRQLHRERAKVSSAAGIEAEPEPYFEPRARKAKLRCQAAQPLKYGYNYADLNASASTKDAPLYSYNYSSTNSQNQGHSGYATPATRTVPISVTPVSPTPPRYMAPASSHRQASHAIPGQATAMLAMPASPATYGESSNTTAPALPHFRDDVWAQSPLPPAQNHTSHAEWFERQPQAQQQQKEEQVMAEYLDSSPAVQTSMNAVSVNATVPANSSPYHHRYNNNPSSSVPGSTNSSPYYRQHQSRHRGSAHDVPSAPFANAGPPGVGVQFYATPEVQQVQMSVHVVHHYPMAAGYNYPSYPATYNSSSATSNLSTNHVYSTSQNGDPRSATSSMPSYTYSGAHSTSNSPYHSAASGMYRYTGECGYPGGQPPPSSSVYGRY